MPGRVRGDPGHVQPAGAVLDEHQHVQPLEQHRLDDQEVTGDNGVRLSGEELPPGRPRPPRHGIDADGVQYLPRRGRSDRVSQRASSPWIRLWPQAGFSRAIRMISAVTDVPVAGRPGRRRLA